VTSRQPPAATPSPSGDRGPLLGLLAAARCVLFDFDGPLTSVFGGHEAHVVAGALCTRIAAWPRTPLVHDPHDPVRILSDVARAFGDSADRHRVAELDRLLSDQEVRAVATARPTGYADQLVQRLVARGVHVAVTTNNSAAAVSRYLELRGLTGCFGPHIHGRAADPRLMKPHPHCVVEAVRGLGVRPEECLMVGDSPYDFQAATAAGVAFLGYARNPAKRQQLTRAGVAHVVESLAPVYEAAADA
jgi:HAD superfamily hydrolase (TIGR01509 family)